MPEPAPHHWWLKRLSMTGVCVLLLCGLLWLAWDWEAHRRLARAKARARAAGVVLTAADIRPAQVRDEDNAAVLLQAALDSLRLGDADLPEPSDFADDPRAMVEFAHYLRWRLEMNADALCLLREARGRRVCEWSKDANLEWGRSPLARAPRIAKLAWLALAQAMLAHSEGDDIEACESVRDALALLRFAPDHQTIRQTTESIGVPLRGAYSVLYAILPELGSSTHPAHVDWVRLRDLIRKIVDDLLDDTWLRRANAQAIRGAPRVDVAIVERATGAAGSDSPELEFADRIAPHLVRAFAKRVPASPFRRAARPYYLSRAAQSLEFAERVGGLLENPDHTSAPALPGVCSWLYLGLDDLDLLTLGDDFAIVMAHDAVLRQLAGRRVCALALALRVYQVERGAVPARLDELVAEYLPYLPDDPLSESGASFRYAPFADTRAIWSSGDYPLTRRINSVFNLGAVFPEGSGAPDFQLTDVPRPALARGALSDFIYQQYRLLQTPQQEREQQRQGDQE